MSSLLTLLVFSALSLVVWSTQKRPLPKPLCQSLRSREQAQRFRLTAVPASEHFPAADSDEGSNGVCGHAANANAVANATSDGPLDVAAPSASSLPTNSTFVGPTMPTATSGATSSSSTGMYGAPPGATVAAANAAQATQTFPTSVQDRRYGGFTSRQLEIIFDCMRTVTQSLVTNTNAAGRAASAAEAAAQHASAAAAALQGVAEAELFDKGKDKGYAKGKAKGFEKGYIKGQGLNNPER